MIILLVRVSHEHEVNDFILKGQDLERIVLLISYSTSEIQRRFLSIVVNDAFVKSTVEAIIKSAATDKVGDGKIFITPIEDAYQ